MFSKTKIVAIVAMSVSVLFFSACSKNDEINSESEQVLSEKYVPPYLSKDPMIQEELRFLVKQGRIRTEDIKKVGLIPADVFPIGDLHGTSNPMDATYAFPDTDFGIITRYAIWETIKKESSNSIQTEKQAWGGTWSRTGALSVRVLPNVPSAWKTAISDACAYWNSKGYTISFGVYSASTNTIVSGEINVYKYPVLNANGTKNTISYAWTDIPAVNGGSPGKTLKINTNQSDVDNLSISAKKLVMVHELAHTLGFAHADYLDSNAYWIANQTAISDCGNGTDPNSVMKNTISLTAPFNGFSTCDGQIFNYFYGLS